MAADKDVTKLKSDMAKVKTHLRKLEAWNRSIVANILRLRRQSAVTGPNVTDPPKPPRP